MHLAQLNVGYVIRDGTAQYNTTVNRSFTYNVQNCSYLQVFTGVWFVSFCALVRCGRAIHSDVVPLRKSYFQ